MLHRVIANKSLLVVSPPSVSPQGPPKRSWPIYVTLVCVVSGVRLLQWQNEFLTLVALAVISTVPLYYLTSHAPIHFEYRYILPVYFFWFILVGLALYWLGSALRLLVLKLIHQATQRERSFVSSVLSS